MIVAKGSSVFGEFNKAKLTQLTDEQFRALMVRVLETQQDDRKENQLLYYKPVSDMALVVHKSTSRYLGVGGGNGASKTDTVLAELVMHATGIYPDTLDSETREVLMSKFRGPVAIRIVVESITTTLYNVVLPKLQWWKWNGADSPGGKRGHWGWIPRHALKGGQWVGAWRDGLRTLTVNCYDPETGELAGESTIQFMAHNQDPSDFASGDFHHILHDEATSYAIWRENEARTMRVGGRMYLAMTWPDDPAIPVDWIFDEVYEPGREGPNKSPAVDWHEMWSTDNPNIDQASVGAQSEKWSDEIQAVRIYGRPIRFSNRVHPLFTDRKQLWCITCNTPKSDVSKCDRCVGGKREITEYCHVSDFNADPMLPTIFLLDPHPRKPHMGLWVQVDTWDDLWVCAEILCEGGPEELSNETANIENIFNFKMSLRLGDPNMLRSPASSRRGVTWRDDFDAVGLRLDLADTSDVGRGRLNEYLAVDQNTKAPRIHIHSRCVSTIRQLQRYVWDDFRDSMNRAQKQIPKDKEDDMPTLLKYLMNFQPTYSNLVRAGKPIKRHG